MIEEKFTVHYTVLIAFFFFLFSFLFFSVHAELVWKVARYSSAAPMHFSECDNYVDGGVLANNPCDTGLMRIQKHYADMGVRLPISCVVSVGSGVFPVRELGSTDAPLGLSWLNLRDSFRRYSNLIQLLTRAVSKHVHV